VLSEKPHFWHEKGVCSGAITPSRLLERNHFLSIPHHEELFTPNPLRNESRWSRIDRGRATSTEFFPRS
jgi:hypothetical protein